MRLIIAEKHSVGQAIAQALGGHAEKHNGYIEVGDDLVTWAQGHLVDLAAPDEYKNHDWGKWSLDTLPIDPTPDWQWKVSRDKGADRQYKVVAGLMRRGDVDMLVDACDPDREGEAIFRRIVTHVGVSKPMRRLWVASLEEDAIRDALASMKDETEYRGLADSAMIRAKADWLIGMNASRAYSLVYNARFTVGRVQTPTLAMIVDRKGKQLRSTDQGRSLIDVVAPKLKDVALTADMERRLSEVEHGQADASQVETEFRDLAARIPADVQTTVRQDHVQAKTRNTESFGGCPRCGKPVVKTGKVFQCSTNRREKQSDGTWRTTEGCGWRAWTTVAGKTITDTTMRGLLAGRKVSLKGFTSRKGSGFDAAILIDKDKGIAFDFNDNKERKRK